GGVIQGIDGNFYGTARSGGNGPLCFSNGYCGAIFKVTRIGTESVLYNFCSQPNCPDGVEPIAPLVQGTDGNFYGSTSSAAGNEDPIISHIKPEDALTTLYNKTGTGLSI